MNRPPTRSAARPAPRQRLLRSVAPALLLVCAWFSACNTARPPPLLPPEPDPVFSQPEWLRQPLSWEKLVSLEDWLEHKSSTHSPGLRIEARLQLNEGRVTYSRKDLEKHTAPPQTVSMRVETARDGFKEILSDPDAGPASKTRATIGLQSAQALLDSVGESRPGIAMIDRAQWKAKAGRGNRLTLLRGAWSRITVHHSDESRSAQTGGTLEESMEVVRLIQKFHMEDPGHEWGDIGYHFLIDSAGRIFEGRELAWQGAHAGGAGGDNNKQNLGICMLGDFQKRGPTPAALNSLGLLIDSLCQQHKIPPTRIYPHKEFTTTQCPGPALTSWLKSHYH